jgi:hypothetical protein
MSVDRFSAAVFGDMPFECSACLLYQLPGLLRECSDGFVFLFPEHACPTIQHFKGAAIIRRRERIGAEEPALFFTRRYRSRCLHLNPDGNRLTHTYRGGRVTCVIDRATFHQSQTARIGSGQLRSHCASCLLDSTVSVSTKDDVDVGTQFYTLSNYEIFTLLHQRRTGPRPHRVHVVDGVRGAGVRGNFYSGWRKHQWHLGRGQHSTEQRQHLDQLTCAGTAEAALVQFLRFSSRSDRRGCQTRPRDSTKESHHSPIQRYGRLRQWDVRHYRACRYFAWLCDSGGESGRYGGAFRRGLRADNATGSGGAVSPVRP